MNHMVIRVFTIIFGGLGMIAALLFSLRKRINKRAKPYADDEKDSDGCSKTGHMLKKVRLNGQDGIVSLEKGLLAVRYEGEHYFDAFLGQGGAASDKELIHFLTKQLKMRVRDIHIETKGFGCSTIAVPGRSGERYFGRNFDWYPCNALIVEAHPTNGYASLSTVNTDFVHIGTRLRSLVMPEEMLCRAALYLPLDGMNEKGLCVSVNMIQDKATICQNRQLPGLTTTTAVRLLLDRAADVKEAVELLKRYDLHASLNFMVHFAIADAMGKSVAVEYVENEMIVTDTPVVTNFYLGKGKYGVGTKQSNIRYQVLMKQLKKQETMTEGQVRDALDSVSKHNYHDRETTEWSIVFDQRAKTATYYHEENYAVGYKVILEMKKDSV